MWPSVNHITNCSLHTHAGKILRVGCLFVGQACGRSASCRSKVVCITFQKADIKP